MFKKILVFMTIIIGITIILSFSTCDNSSGNENGGSENLPNNPTPAKFTGYDANGNKYELVVSKNPNRSSRVITDLMPGDNYTLTIYFQDGTVLATSSGEVILTGSGKIKLKHKNGDEFEVDVNDNKIVRIVIDYDIPLDDGGKLKPPEDNLNDENQNNSSTGGSSVTGVSLIPPYTTLMPGCYHPLTPVLNPSDAANKNVTWSSNNPSAATVRNGIVTAIAPGSATITVTTVDGGFSAECVVTVPGQVVCDHVWGNWIRTTTPTCTSGGMERRSCSSCGDIETRSIPALGHSWSAWKTDQWGIFTEETARKCTRCGLEQARIGGSIYDTTMWYQFKNFPSDGYKLDTGVPNVIEVKSVYAD